MPHWWNEAQRRPWEEDGEDVAASRARRAGAWRAHDRRTACGRLLGRRWPRLALLGLSAASIAVGIAVLPRTVPRDPWTGEPLWRHYAAGRGCDVARLVGLAPAHRGQPGYWPHLDSDNDGIACEPYPRR